MDIPAHSLYIGGKISDMLHERRTNILHTTNKTFLQILLPQLWHNTLLVGFL